MGSLMVFDPKQQHQLPGKLPPPDEGWKPLKDMFYELGLIGALFVVYLGVTKHPEYFFPFWVPEFPARTELLEVSGELRFHRGPSRGGSRYVTISLDRYGLKK